jgi:hypothetical protein
MACGYCLTRAEREEKIAKYEEMLRLNPNAPDWVRETVDHLKMLHNQIIADGESCMHGVSTVGELL